MAVLFDDEPPVGRERADGGAIEPVFGEDFLGDLLPIGLQDNQHALLAFGEHHLVRRHAGFARRDRVEVECNAKPAFARHLDRHPKTDDPDADMGKMGHAYLEYAHRHALEYGLMFNTPLPDGKKHPEMMANAKHAFALLCDALRRKARQRGGIPDDEAVMLDALFIWSGLHGLASIAASSTVATLEITPPVLARSGMHLLQRLSQAMDTPK